MVDDPMLTISPNFPSSDLDYDVVSSYNSSDDDDDVDVDVDVDVGPLNDIVSSPSPSSDSLPPPPSSAAVTVAITPPPPTTTITTLALPTTTNTTASAAGVDSRRLFQRLWTDEDEIELLQGFLEYTATRGPTASGHYHDTAAFYDQIQSKLQLHFNKNQLVEKLRRLKKKYRTVLAKINSNNNSKDFVFKSPHDQATFEISAKIWTNLSAPTPPPPAAITANYQTGFQTGFLGGDFNDGEINPVTVVAATPPRPANSSYVVSQINLNSAGVGVGLGGSGGGFDPMLTSLTGNGGGLPKLCTRKRSRISTPTKVEENCNAIADNTNVIANANANANNNVGSVGVNSPLQGLVEETLRNCLSPVLKELISSVVNGAGSGGHSGLGGAGGGGEGGGSVGFKGVAELGLNAMPLNFSGVGVDEKWRKQQILELEVYSKRLELVQEQIKVSLEELRSMES